MIKLARKRNDLFIRKGLIDLVQKEFLKFEANKLYVKIVAFNVNVFLKGNKKVTEPIKKLTKRDGRIYIFYQAPYELSMSSIKQIIRNISDCNFKIVETVFKKLNPTSAICIIASL